MPSKTKLLAAALAFCCNSASASTLTINFSGNLKSYTHNTAYNPNDVPVGAELKGQFTFLLDRAPTDSRSSNDHGLYRSRTDWIQASIDQFPIFESDDSRPSTAYDDDFADVYNDHETYPTDPNPVQDRLSVRDHAQTDSGCEITGHYCRNISLVGDHGLYGFFNPSLLQSDDLKQSLTAFYTDGLQKALNTPYIAFTYFGGTSGKGLQGRIQLSEVSVVAPVPIPGTLSLMAPVLIAGFACRRWFGTRGSVQG